MAKMKVICQRLQFGDLAYATGDVLECTDDEAYGLIKDEQAVPVSDSETVVEGEKREVDPVEAAVLAGEFDGLRESGVIAAPAGAAKLSTPIAGPGAFFEGMADRLPSDSIVEPTRYEA